MLIYESCVLRLFLFLIEVPVRSPQSKRSDIRVLGVSILPLSTILIFYFRIVPKVWYFFSIYCSLLKNSYVIIVNRTDRGE